MKRTERGQGRICLETKVTLRVKDTGKVCNKLILKLFNTNIEEVEDFSGLVRRSQRKITINNFSIRLLYLKKKKKQLFLCYYCVTDTVSKKEFI